MLYQPFILQVINKFTDVDITTDNIDEKLEEGLDALKRVTDVQSLIRIHYATVAMANSLDTPDSDDEKENTIKKILEDYK